MVEKLTWNAAHKATDGKTATIVAAG